MHLLRKQNLSVVYFVEDLFSSYSNVTIVDEFPDAELELPTISVRDLDIDVEAYELGNRAGLRDRIWVIDVFGSNKDMRDEFAYLILDALESGVPVYDYDEGFPPNVSPTKLGTLSPSDITITPITIFPDLVEKLYWRTQITFRTKYNPV